jgi:elongation factor P
MLNYNEVTPGKIIVLDGEPYEALTSHVFRKQQRKPVNAVKLRNVKTGKIAERSFHMAETFEEAEIIQRPVTFIYKAKGECWFHEDGKPQNRFSLPESMLGGRLRFMKEKMTVQTMEFDDEVIGITMPIKMDLVVTEAPPAVKGDTATGATKQITLETGAIINAPLFINQGDIIRVNTETGDYVERAEKR